MEMNFALPEYRIGLRGYQWLTEMIAKFSESISARINLKALLFLDKRQFGVVLIKIFDFGQCR